MSTHDADQRLSTHPEMTGPVPGNAVLNEIRRQLLGSPFAAIKHLRCDFHAGVATLRGRVPTFYTRQIAQTLVRNIDGVVELDDRVTVCGACGPTTGS